MFEVLHQVKYKGVLWMVCWITYAVCSPGSAVFLDPDEWIDDCLTSQIHVQRRAGVWSSKTGIEHQTPAEGCMHTPAMTEHLSVWNLFVCLFYFFPLWMWTWGTSVVHANSTYGQPKQEKEARKQRVCLQSNQTLHSTELELKIQAMYKYSRLWNSCLVSVSSPTIT